MEIAKIGSKCMLWTVLNCIVIDSAVGKLCSNDDVHGHRYNHCCTQYHIIMFATANSKITWVSLLCQQKLLRWVYHNKVVINGMNSWCISSLLDLNVLQLLCSVGLATSRQTPQNNGDTLWPACTAWLVKDRCSISDSFCWCLLHWL